MRKRWNAPWQRTKPYREETQAIVNDKKITELDVKIKEMAAMDSLTRLTDRRKFDETLIIEWDRVSQSNCHIAIALLQIDYFKEYMAVYGEAAASQCLAKTASILRRCVQHSHECAARFDNDTFAVILPRTSCHQAYAVCERICKEIITESLPHECSPILSYITFSVGLVCMAPQLGSSCALSLNTAQKALAMARHSGGNRIEVSSDHSY